MHCFNDKRALPFLKDHVHSGKEGMAFHGGGVAVNADGTLFASADIFTHCVSIYAMDARGGPPVIVGTPGRSGEVDAKFNSPDHLYFVHRHGVDSLLIVDGGNNRIVEVSARGEFMRAISIWDPVRVAYCEVSDRIAISFWNDSHPFQLLNYRTELRVGKKRFWRSPSVKMCRPFGMGFYKKGRYILVADWGNHCVNMFCTHTGGFVSEFASKADGINWPRDVHVLDDGTVIVQQGFSGPCSVVTFPPNGASETFVFGTGAFNSAYSSLLNGIVVKNSNDGSVFLLSDASSRLAWLCVCCE